MKRISPVCVLALWSALNSQSMLAAGQAAPSSVKRSQYVGEPMSLSVQNLDVRTVLQSLADFTGFFHGRQFQVQQHIVGDEGDAQPGGISRNPQVNKGRARVAWRCPGRRRLGDTTGLPEPPIV